MTPAAYTAAAIWAGWFTIRLIFAFARMTLRRWATRDLDMRRGAIPGDVRRRVCRGPIAGWPRLCRSCWHRVGRECGHLIRWADGGPDVPSNMVPQCRACNARSSSRTTFPALVRWAVPWVGWRFPVPTPVIAAVAVYVSTRQLVRG